jgi:hypothetical protein
MVSAAVAVLLVAGLVAAVLVVGHRPARHSGTAVAAGNPAGGQPVYPLVPGSPGTPSPGKSGGNGERSPGHSGASSPSSAGTDSPGKSSGGSGSAGSAGPSGSSGSSSAPAPELVPPPQNVTLVFLREGSPLVSRYEGTFPISAVNGPVTFTISEPAGETNDFNAFYTNASDTSGSSDVTLYTGQVLTGTVQPGAPLTVYIYVLSGSGPEPPYDITVNPGGETINFTLSTS